MDLQCHLRLPCPPFGLQASSAAKLPLSFRDLVVSQSRMTLSTSISSALAALQLLEGFVMIVHNLETCN